MSDMPEIRTMTKAELENEYQRLLLYAQHLEDQNKSMKISFANAEKEMNELIKEVKNLCISILERDRNLMSLGSQKPLSTRSVKELLVLTKESDVNQQKDKASKMSELIKINQQRGETIQSLKDQLARALRSAQNALDEMPDDNEVAQNTEETSDAQKPSAQEKTAEKTVSGGTLITGDDDGAVEAKIIDDDDQPVVHSKPLLQKTGDGGLSTAPRVRVHVTDLQTIVDQFTDEMWEILRVIGDDGISELPEIIEAVQKTYPCSQSKLRMCALNMGKSTILIAHQLNTGLRRNFYAFELSEIGARIFAEKYGREPRISEVQSLTRDHGNPTHGYGIKDMCTVLRASNEYEAIITNRKKCTIRVRGGQSYIPDAIARLKDGSGYHYYEYECGNHTQEDFNDKCNKAIQVTTEVRFVCPSLPIAKDVILEQVKKWIASRGGIENLPDIRVLITTLVRLKDGRWEYTIPEQDAEQGAADDEAAQSEALQIVSEG